MPADAREVVVGAHHHGHRVPADVAADALLHELVAGILGLPIRRDGVDVGRLYQGGEAHPLHLGLLEELGENVVGALHPVELHQRIQGVQPLLGLRRVDVLDLGGYLGSHLHGGTIQGSQFGC